MTHDPIGQGLKSEYSARATRGYHKLQFRQGFTRKVWEVETFEFKKCSRNFLGSLLTLQEEGILPSFVYFPF